MLVILLSRACNPIIPAPVPSRESKCPFFSHFLLEKLLRECPGCIPGVRSAIFFHRTAVNILCTVFESQPGSFESCFWSFTYSLERPSSVTRARVYWTLGPAGSLRSSPQLAPGDKCKNLLPVLLWGFIFYFCLSVLLLANLGSLISNLVTGGKVVKKNKI